MSAFKSIHDLSQTREEYGEMALIESDMHVDPIEQFKFWFEQYAQTDPITSNAMVLSTVDANSHPDSRIVLLKELMDGEFIFYTHYDSTKGLQMAHNPFVALNFFWPQLARQVRICGIVRQVSAAQSDEYFYSRPLESQFSTMISHQSSIIASREDLQTAYQKVRIDCAKPKRPETWGGYAVKPQQIEFWQGRDNRLHDRIQYIFQENGWLMQRLAP